MEKVKCVVSIGYYDFDFGEDYNKAVNFIKTANLYRAENCCIECRIY